MGKFLDKILNVANKFGNTLLEGLTAGYWQGKDNYTGSGDNPTPTVENIKNQTEEIIEPKPTIPSTPETPAPETPAPEINTGIVDKTDENIEIPNYYGENNIFNWIEEQQQKQWAREDEIRKEVQAREDTAYSRAIADMRRAGINPNLVGNITPASSGGGITQATGKTYEVYEQEMQRYLTELEKLMDMYFQGSENEKDRFAEIIGNLLNFAGFNAIAKSKK